MKTVKKIAWLLSFVLIVSAVFGNVNLRATAQGGGTTFTITVDDQSGVAGNAVTYSFDNNSWNPVSSGTPIDISGNDVIHVQVTKADNVNVIVRNLPDLHKIRILVESPVGVSEILTWRVIHPMG